ncbi:MAG TPA: hopanoid biosynthesis-associated RND transporter HpnN, partial [Xanthobacteraceae bacterium]|nr:hopanoid biosynthesis-associated RND transporter HpnN [Xanthobacteraceae bacterium]
MNSAIFASTVDFCLRRKWLVILTSVAILAGSTVYVARNFKLNSDISTLLSPDLPWRQRDQAYQDAFPQLAHSIVAVVSAPTPELAGAATASLVGRLVPQSDKFHSVSAAATGEFFARNGLLYLSPDELSARLDKLRQAVPLLRVLASDQSLRGLSRVLGMGLQGVAVGRFPLDAMARPLTMASDTVEAALAGKRAAFSWQALVNGKANPEDLNQLVQIYPVLDYAALE